MSRQNINARNSFFRANSAKMNMLNKRRKEIKMAKNGEVLPDPKVVTGESQDEMVNDPEVVEE